MRLKRVTPRSLLLSTVIAISICTIGLSSSDNVKQQASIPVAADRIRNEPPSVWVEFIQLALEHKPLNLGQGFPDFAAPQYLVESLTNATRLSDPETVLNHQYTRPFGHPRLIKALQRYYKTLRHFGSLEDPKTQILITVGAYEALFNAITAFVNPGDEVILIDPAFDAYAPMVAMAGGKSVFVPLKLQPDSQHNNDSRQKGISSESFQLDLQDLKSKLSNRTRAIVLNTPNNPLGKSFSHDELVALSQICIEHNLLVIADEVYEQFYYDTTEHKSVASLPGMWSRTITIGSAGKTFSVTGWKIGWAFGPEHLIRYMQLVHQTAVYTVATPLQEAVARALEHEMQLIEESRTGVYWVGLRAELKKKRDLMARVLEKARLKPVIPQGGYFMMADFSELAKAYPEYESVGYVNKSEAINTNDYKFARWLSKVKHLQGIPGSAFYSEPNKHLGANLIRFCFIKKDETLRDFESLIEKFIADGKSLA